MARLNHYAEEAKQRPVPTCPKCGRKAGESNTRYGLRNGCCGMWSWDRHPLVSEATHRARNAAHKAFDALWRDGPLSRGAAYRQLAEQLGMSRADCHIKLMDEATAGRVAEAVERIRIAITEKESA